MVGVILAAGTGSRFKQSSNENNYKILEKISGQYLIEFALENLAKLNIDETIIVVGEQGESIKTAIGHHYKNIDIVYVSQSNQLGLINAFVQALPFIKDDGVVFQLADEVFVDLKTETAKECLSSCDADFYCGITYETNPDKIKGNFSVETDNCLTIKNCVEKPTAIINNIKGTGFCIFKQEAIAVLKKNYNATSNFPYDLCDFFNLMITNGKAGKAFCIAEKEFNINTNADLEEARNYISEKIK